MIRHPLLLSVISIDVLSLLLVAAATVSALRIVTGGSPESAANGRIAPGGKAGTASIRGRAGLALLALSTLLLIFGIAGVLPKIVPGAMCGEGVLQATKGAMGRALALRGLALGVLAVWHLLDRLNRSRPDSPLATQAARTLLLASPLAVLAVYDTFQAILRLDVNRPVDCCTAVYGQVRNVDPAGGGWSIPGRVLDLGACPGRHRDHLPRPAPVALIASAGSTDNRARFPGDDPLGSGGGNLAPPILCRISLPISQRALCVVPLPAGEQARRLPAVRLLDRGCCGGLCGLHLLDGRGQVSCLGISSRKENPYGGTANGRSQQSSSWLSWGSRQSCGDFSSASGSSDCLCQMCRSAASRLPQIGFSR